MRLRVDDIDLHRRILTMQRCKGGRASCRSATILWSSFTGVRGATRRSWTPPAFFIRRNATALTLRAASDVLRRLLRDLKPLRGPR